MPPAGDTQQRGQGPGQGQGQGQGPQPAEGDTGPTPAPIRTGKTRRGRRGGRGRSLSPRSCSGMGVGVSPATSPVQGSGGWFATHETVRHQPPQHQRAVLVTMPVPSRHHREEMSESRRPSATAPWGHQDLFADPLSLSWMNTSRSFYQARCAFGHNSPIRTINQAPGVSPVGGGGGGGGNGLGPGGDNGGGAGNRSPVHSGGAGLRARERAPLLVERVHVHLGDMASLFSNYRRRGISMSATDMEKVEEQLRGASALLHQLQRDLSVNQHAASPNQSKPPAPAASSCSAAGVPVVVAPPSRLPSDDHSPELPLFRRSSDRASVGSSTGSSTPIPLAAATVDTVGFTGTGLGLGGVGVTAGTKGTTVPAAEEAARRGGDVQGQCADEAQATEKPLPGSCLPLEIEISSDHLCQNPLQSPVTPCSIYSADNEGEVPKKKKRRGKRGLRKGKKQMEGFAGFPLPPGLGPEFAGQPRRRLPKAPSLHIMGGEHDLSEFCLQDDSEDDDNSGHTKSLVANTEAPTGPAAETVCRGDLIQPRQHQPVQYSAQEQEHDGKARIAEGDGGARVLSEKGDGSREGGKDGGNSVTDTMLLVQEAKSNVGAVDPCVAATVAAEAEAAGEATAVVMMTAHEKKGTPSNWRAGAAEDGFEGPIMVSPHDGVGHEMLGTSTPFSLSPRSSSDNVRGNHSSMIPETRVPSPLTRSWNNSEIIGGLDNLGSAFFPEAGDDGGRNPILIDSAIPPSLSMGSPTGYVSEHCGASDGGGGGGGGRSSIGNRSCRSSGVTEEMQIPGVRAHDLRDMGVASRNYSAGMGLRGGRLSIGPGDETPTGVGGGGDRAPPVPWQQAYYQSKGSSNTPRLYGGENNPAGAPGGRKALLSRAAGSAPSGVSLTTSGGATCGSWVTPPRTPHATAPDSSSTSAEDPGGEQRRNASRSYSPTRYRATVADVQEAFERADTRIALARGQSQGQRQGNEATVADQENVGFPVPEDNQCCAGGVFLESSFSSSRGVGMTGGGRDEGSKARERVGSERDEGNELSSTMTQLWITEPEPSPLVGDTAPTPLSGRAPSATTGGVNSSQTAPQQQAQDSKLFFGVDCEAGGHSVKGNVHDVHTVVEISRRSPSPRLNVAKGGGEGGAAAAGVAAASGPASSGGRDPAAFVQEAVTIMLGTTTPDTGH